MDMQAVVCALHNASCQQPHLLIPAEKQIAEWSEQPGFHHMLLQIYLNQSLDLNVRWLAVLCFKNGIDKYWRVMSCGYKIAEDEKKSIREILATVCCQLESQEGLALQLAVCTGKVARQDCPINWPQILPILLNLICNESGRSNRSDTEEVILRRALLTLHHTIKQISSRRLGHDRKKFQDIVSEIFPQILIVYKNEVQQLTHNPPAERLVANIKRAHFCLKILRKMIAYGFKDLKEAPLVNEVYCLLFSHFHELLLLRSQQTDAVRLILEKYISLIMKCLTELSQIHQDYFMSLFLVRTLQLVIRYAFASDVEEFSYEKLCVECINLLESILINCKTITNKSATVTSEIHEARENVFNKFTLEQICYKIVMKYFVLSREELLTWDGDPEDFCIDVEGGDSWKFSLRPAAERLFKSMFHFFIEEFKPVLIRLMNETMGLADSNNIEAILNKDAVYNAVGLASFDLYDEVNFDDWFTNNLVQELNIADSNYRIIRRRVIWLVGQWAAVKFSAGNRPLLYEACIHLLTNDPDFVVRFNTAITLKAVIDDFDFELKVFSPYFPTIFSLLFNLLKEARECDLKLRILTVMSFLLGVMGSAIQDCAGPLVQFLPELWKESEDHNMLRCAILYTMQNLVRGLGSHMVMMRDMLINVINIATDTKQPSHIYLLEDGLELWLCTLEYTPSPPATTNADPFYSNLLLLYRNLIPTMETSTETLQICLQITTAYILLCPIQFLQTYGRQVLDVLSEQLSDLIKEAKVLIFSVFETIIKTCGRDGAMLVRGATAVASKELFESIEESYPKMLTAHLTLLSRIILTDYDSFIWIIAELRKNCKNLAEDVLTELLRLWCSKLSLVHPDEKRKLAAIGLCRLIADYNTSILPVWTRAVECVAEVIYDIMDEDTQDDRLMIGKIYLPGDPSSEDQLQRFLDGDTGEPHDYTSDSCIESEHKKRRHRLCCSDPEYTIVLRDCLIQALQQFSLRIDKSTLAQLTANLNDDTKSLLQPQNGTTNSNEVAAAAAFAPSN